MSAKVQPIDLIPQDTELEIDGQEPVNLRALSIDDWAWMQKRWGKEAIEEKLSNLDPKEMMIILYRLMDRDGKLRFRPEETTDFDDDGNEVPVKLTGPDVLGRHLKGVQGLQRSVRAFEECLGVKADMEVLTGGGAGKKLGKKKKVKRTGRKSMIQSPVSTVTP